MFGRLERGESRQSPFERFELDDEVLIIRGSFASLLAVSRQCSADRGPSGVRRSLRIITLISFDSEAILPVNLATARKISNKKTKWWDDRVWIHR